MRGGAIVLPVAAALLGLAAWQGLVTANDVPDYVLPSPAGIARSLYDNRDLLARAMLVTAGITAQAFATALAAGAVLAFLCARVPALESLVFPYAVILQSTPVIAIAPILLIWVGLDHASRALLAIATFIAFFPVLSNATLGFKSIDPGLDDMMSLYGARPWQRFALLDLPSALPRVLAGARISGGLALVGTVVAEFAAGVGGDAGLAWRINEAAAQLDIARMFAGLVLLCILGVTIYATLSAFARRAVGRWSQDDE